MSELSNIWHMNVHPETRKVQFYMPRGIQPMPYQNVPKNVSLYKIGTPVIRSKKRRAPTVVRNFTLKPKSNNQAAKNMYHSRPVDRMNSERSTYSMNHFVKHLKQQSKAHNEQLIAEQEAESQRLKNEEQNEMEVIELANQMLEDKRTPEERAYYAKHHKFLIGKSKKKNRVKGGCGCGFGGKRGGKRSTKKRSTKKRSTRR